MRDSAPLWRGLFFCGRCLLGMSTEQLYREKAKEGRQKAAATSNDLTRLVWREIAKGFERLADMPPPDSVWKVDRKKIAPLVAMDWFCRRGQTYLSFPRAAPRARNRREADDGAVSTALTNECRKIDIEARGPRRAARLHVRPIARRRAAIGAPPEQSVSVLLELA
jgi:hypothetical protein